MEEIPWPKQKATTGSLELFKLDYNRIRTNALSNSTSVFKENLYWFLVSSSLGTRYRKWADKLSQQRSFICTDPSQWDPSWPTAYTILAMWLSRVKTVFRGHGTESKRPWNNEPRVQVPWEEHLPEVRRSRFKSCFFNNLPLIVLGNLLHLRAPQLPNR